MIYLFVSGICDDILYDYFKFIIIYLFMLFMMFLYKRIQISGPKKMRDKSIRRIYDKI